MKVLKARTLNYARSAFCSFSTHVYSCALILSFIDARQWVRLLMTCHFKSSVNCLYFIRFSIVWVNLDPCWFRNLNWKSKLVLSKIAKSFTFLLPCNLSQKKSWRDCILQSNNFISTWLLSQLEEIQDRA